MTNEQLKQLAKDLVIGTLWFLLSSSLVSGLINSVWAFLASHYSPGELIKGFVGGFILLIELPGLLFLIVIGLVGALIGSMFRRNKIVIPIIMGIGFGLIYYIFFVLSNIFFVSN